jgi:hypothetical protein
LNIVAGDEPQRGTIATIIIGGKSPKIDTRRKKGRFATTGHEDRK